MSAAHIPTVTCHSANDAVSGRSRFRRPSIPDIPRIASIQLGLLSTLFYQRFIIFICFIFVYRQDGGLGQAVQVPAGDQPGRCSKRANAEQQFLDMCDIPCGRWDEACCLVGWVWHRLGIPHPGRSNRLLSWGANPGLYDSPSWCSALFPCCGGYYLLYMPSFPVMVIITFTHVLRFPDNLSVNPISGYRVLHGQAS